MTEPKWYDVTISRAVVPDIKQVIEQMEIIGCERYVIGEEIGKDGFQHWQTRLVLEKGRSWAQMKEIFKTCGHVTPSHVRNFSYCEKAGNFYRSWEKALGKYSMLELLPWQQQALECLTNQGPRRVTVIIDEHGNHGKTYLRKFLQANHFAEYIPPMAEWKDLMRVCMAKPGRGYCFDLPRADTIKQKKGLWMAIESIKDGYLFDDRYTFQEKWIEPPNILVFANEEPPYELLSKDRWDCQRIVTFGPIDTLAEVGI